MEPGEALGTAAQVAVTLAGFAGVVVVFHREAIHEWSPVDKFRLRTLLGNSVLPLALSMIAQVLLMVEPPLTDVWRWCSGVAFVVLLAFGIAINLGFRRFDVRELEGTSANLVFYVSSGIAIGVTLLQLYNVVFLGAFWPFFAGIVLQIIGATFQFARMIRPRPE
jgi:hypothetical protein